MKIGATDRTVFSSEQCNRKSRKKDYHLLSIELETKIFLKTTNLLGISISSTNNTFFNKIFSLLTSILSLFVRSCNQFCNENNLPPFNIHHAEPFFASCARINSYYRHQSQRKSLSGFQNCATQNKRPLIIQRVMHGSKY